MAEHGRQPGDLQAPQVAKWLGARAELLYELHLDDQDPHLLPEVAHRPASYLLAEATRLVDEAYAARTVHRNSYSGHGVVSYVATFVTHVTSEQHRWLSPDMVVRVDREPNAHGRLVPKGAVIGLAKRDSRMDEGRYLLVASGGSDPQLATYKEYWQHGQWQRERIEDEAQESQLLATLFLRLEDSRDMVSNREARKRVYEWLRNGDWYLV